MLMANSPAILTDAFPFNQRGMALGINQVAGISGQFIGLILGGVLAAVDWRLVFLGVGPDRDRSAPSGPTCSLREIGERDAGRRSTGGATSRSRSA